jgi:SPP1 family predicted phage head-tail adaptor
MNINPSRFNKRLTFKKRAITKNQNGLAKPSFVDAFTCWGEVLYIMPMNKDYEHGGVVDAEIRGKCNVRYRTDITADMLMTYNGMIYQVNDVEFSPDNKYVTCVLKRYTDG